MSGLVLDVFVDTPTGNQRGPPSTSFPWAEQLHPFGVRLRSARSAHLRSASPQRGEAGGKKDKLQKQVYTGLSVAKLRIEDVGTQGRSNLEVQGNLDAQIGLVEPTGIEPATFSLRTRRSTN